MLLFSLSNLQFRNGRKEFVESARPDFRFHLLFVILFIIKRILKSVSQVDGELNQRHDPYVHVRKEFIESAGSKFLFHLVFVMLSLLVESVS